MRIYHGQTSPNALQQARDAAPSRSHGYEWNPDYMTPHDDPYILDNGAFAAYRDNELWDADAFAGRVAQIETMPRDPDFVILPDVVTNPSRTKERATQWAGIIDYQTAYPAQDGVNPEDCIDICDRLGCGTIFVGGTVEWKRRNAEAFVETAHAHGFDCHIGRPGDLQWANHIGADSVDTTSIVRSQSWHRLEKLDAGQQRVTDL